MVEIMSSVTDPTEKETLVLGHLSVFSHADPKHKANIKQQQLRLLYDRFIYFSCLTILYCCFPSLPLSAGADHAVRRRHERRHQAR